MFGMYACSVFDYAVCMTLARCADEFVDLVGREFLAYIVCSKPHHLMSLVVIAYDGQYANAMSSLSSQLVGMRYLQVTVELAE
jgi:hypothetical protein